MVVELVSAAEGLAAVVPGDGRRWRALKTAAEWLGLRQWMLLCAWGRRGGGAVAKAEGDGGGGDGGDGAGLRWRVT